MRSMLPVDLRLYPVRAFVPVCCGAAYFLVHRSRRWGTLTFASGSGQLSLVEVLARESGCSTKLNFCFRTHLNRSASVGKRFNRSYT